MDIIKKNIKDILDIKGKNNNFLNDQPFSDLYKELAAKWGKLPMYKDIDSIELFFKLIDTCNVILLQSSTGSGKTVLVPKLFLKYVKTMNIAGKIAITNPKILTTIYNAEYGAKTLDVTLGKEVGYKYKGAPLESTSEETRLLYCTDGLILSRLLGGDSLLSEYIGIIIDEAHERHIQIDILLKLLKDLIIKRPEFKLIIMSATINAKVFKDYFKVQDIKYGEMEVSGETTFPITQNWLDKKTKITDTNYVEIAVDKCFEIIDSSTNGDIIVFVPTTKDAEKGCRLIQEECPSKLKTKKTTCNKLYCIEVYSKMDPKKKDLAVSKDLYKEKGYDRKIIFATNVAESSITFDGLVYVIDTGYELSNYYDYIENSYVVTKKFTSQAQIKQRIGRSGRTQPGIAYHLYTKEQYKQLNEYPEPNISSSDLTDFVLSFIKYSKVIKNMLKLVQDMITVPKIEQIVSAIYKLHFTKSIKLILSEDFDNKTDKLLFPSDIDWLNIKSYRDLEKYNGTTTTLGYCALKFSSSPLISSLTIIMGKYYGCQKEMIQIMAICEVTDSKADTLFIYDRKDIKIVQDYFKDYIHIGSDHLTVLNIYKELYLEDKTEYLNKKLFGAIKERIIQLERTTEQIKEERYEYMREKYNLVTIKPYDNTIDNIKSVLTISHKFNLIKHVSKINYQSINYLRNSEAKAQYISIMPKNEQLEHAICHTLVNVFNNKSYQFITQTNELI
jgi:pre-mRNA-splicing factor ATP-dependent RNA helicase DHX15/PRP43